MSSFNHKSMILRDIKKHYHLKKDSDFARFLGIKPTTLSSWYSRNTFDIDLVYSKCGEIDANWLITGSGNMLKSNTTTMQEDEKGIPLIPVDAMAGFATGESSIMENTTERFIVPSFEGADYLITVKGYSMYPRYNSGDIVACRKLTLNNIFFQWNKVYVLDTVQGALIKRIRKGKDDSHVLLVSDNNDFEPFELKKSEINAIAIVMGVIRLE